MWLLFTELIHFSTSLFVGFIFFDSAGWLGVILAMLSGFLIDSDHFIDYMIYTKDLSRFSLSKFLSSEHFSKSGKLFIFFHGWEYAIIFSILGIIFNQPLLLVLSISNFLHLLVDQLTNKVKLSTYFVILRAIRNWKSSC